MRLDLRSFCIQRTLHSSLTEVVHGCRAILPVNLLIVLTCSTISGLAQFTAFPGSSSRALPSIAAAASYRSSFYLYDAQDSCSFPAESSTSLVSLPDQPQAPQAQSDGDCICICHQYRVGNDNTTCLSDYFARSYPLYSQGGSCTSDETPSGECQCRCRASNRPDVCNPPPPGRPAPPPPAPGPAGVCGGREGGGRESCLCVCAGACPAGP